MRKIKSIFKQLFIRERSFSSVVIFNFIVFSVVFLSLVILGLIGLGHLFLQLSDEYFFYDDLIEYKEVFEAEQYDQINLNFLGDKKGWLVIKNSEGEVLHEMLSNNITESEKKSFIANDDFDSVVYYVGESSTRLEKRVELFISNKSYFKEKDEEYTSYARISQLIFFLFVLIAYIITIVFISKLLSNRIKRPINSMKYVMLNFTDKKKEIPEHYTNIKEFSDLFRVLNEMTEALNKSEKERLDLEKSRVDMLASLSHDIKTPLASIQGYSKAIQDGYVSEDGIKSAVEIIESKSNEVIEMVNLLHEYIKLEHSEYPLSLKRVDVVEALRVWLAECYDEIDTKGYQLVINLPDFPVMHLIDIFHLRRAIMNLIYNAINHNQPGITIQLSLEIEEDFVHIWLEDTGKGLPDMSGEQLFTPFSKGDDSRTSKGSGLGLAIVWQIIHRHNGQLIIEPENESYKTRFHIKLDRKTSSEN